ncbi:MAG TPA: trypsin-like peptidase domain-containing protein [Miltoncostaeaceae bacterium]|nr:trypsin-like peptidase domain-containing protein [Miltoncostaeaceae bacterium]
MSDALPPLEPRHRSDGLPPLAPRPDAEQALPQLEPATPPPSGGLPPIAPGRSGSDAPPPPPASPRGRPRGRTLGMAAAVAVAVIGAGVAGGLTVSALEGDPAAPPAAEQTTGPQTTRTALEVPRTDDLATAVARVAPTVVQVQTDAGSQGSGVIVEPSGLIVTNNHVIRGADRVTLLTQDERRVPATVVSADQRQDLAILEPDGPVGRGAELAGEGAALDQGDRVFAIGSPFGLQNTVTAGIVSNTGRVNPRNGVPMIQIDAPINPGNSGGGLFDLDGRLIGIPTSILGPISGNVGIGFAVPVSRVRALLDGATAP